MEKDRTMVIELRESGDTLRPRIRGAGGQREERGMETEGTPHAAKGGRTKVWGEKCWTKPVN